MRFFRRPIIAAILLLSAATLATALRALPASSAPGDLLAQALNAAKKDGIVVTLANEHVRSWRAPVGHDLRRFAVAGGPTTFATLTSRKKLNNRSAKWTDRGASVELPLSFNNKTMGGRVEIGVIARRSQPSGAPFLSLVYATQQAGNSGWRKIKLTSEFALSTISYDVPRVAGRYRHPPIVILNADPAGSGRAVDLLALYVRPQPSGR